MGWRDKFPVYAVGLVIAFVAALTIVPDAASAAASAKSRPSEAPRASGAAHGPAPACFARHQSCERGAVAVGALKPPPLATLPAARLLKVAASLPAAMRESLAHRAASLFILFRNLRQ